MTTLGEAANRLADTIGTIKWIVITLLLVLPLGGLAISVLADDGTVPAAIGVLLGSLLVALITWIVFGWFEQTLRLLLVIARNTTS